MAPSADVITAYCTHYAASVTSVGWQVTLTLLHVSTRSGVAGYIANCYIRILYVLLLLLRDLEVPAYLRHANGHSSLLLAYYCYSSEIKTGEGI